MSLDICPDCGKSVSVKAKACSGCGSPIKSEPYTLAMVFFFGVIAVGIVCLAIFNQIQFFGWIVIGLGIFGITATVLRKFFLL